MLGKVVGFVTVPIGPLYTESHISCNMRALDCVSFHVFLHLNRQIHTNVCCDTHRERVFSKTVDYVLSELKQLRKKSDVYRYTGSMHCLLKWQHLIYQLLSLIQKREREWETNSITAFDWITFAQRLIYIKLYSEQYAMLSNIWFLISSPEHIQILIYYFNVFVLFLVISSLFLITDC